MQITIDGPAAAGKTTMARALASKYGLLCVDTGAFYRTAAAALRRGGITREQLEDGTLPSGTEKILDDSRISGKPVNGKQVMCLGNTELHDSELRGEETGNMASAVSAFPEIRAKVNDAIRKYAGMRDCIMEGRDTGTVILPRADVKFFLTASISVRAERRMMDLYARGECPEYSDVRRDLEERDTRDETRNADPLRPADDAVIISNTDMSPWQCLAEMSCHINGRLEKE